jgi:SAM-dependent methyltransferase
MSHPHGDAIRRPLIMAFMNRAKRVPAYEEDLAYVHDVGFGGFAEDASAGLLKLLRGAGIRDGLVVDLGCGSGIWARRLSEAGYRVAGVDISPAMIELARRRAPAGEFHVKSFGQFEFPACRAITALGEVLCYQFDRRNSGRALSRFFRRAHEALASRGLLIFDIAEVGLDRDRPPEGRVGDDWACLVRFEYDDPSDQLIRHITTFRRIGRAYRRREETHRVQLYSVSHIARLLGDAGFRVCATRHYGDYALLPGRVGFIARKR